MGQKRKGGGRQLGFYLECKLFVNYVSLFIVIVSDKSLEWTLSHYWTKNHLVSGSSWLSVSTRIQLCPVPIT